MFIFFFCSLSTISSSAKIWTYDLEWVSVLMLCLEALDRVLSKYLKWHGIKQQRLGELYLCEIFLLFDEQWFFFLPFVRGRKAFLTMCKKIDRGRGYSQDWHYLLGDSWTTSNIPWVLLENTQRLSAEMGCSVGGAGRQTIPALEELTVW